jgi:lipoprotein NlpD
MSLRTPDSPYRVVVAGDTLYSIAWESGRDYRELARWNRIPAPYTIKPGQRLRVTPPGPSHATATSGKTVTAREDSRRSETKPPPSATSGRPDKKATSKSLPVRRPDTGTPAPGKKTSNGTSATERPKPTSVATKPKTGRTSRNIAVAGGWVWPTGGKVLNRYSESESKGLDIGGARGEPVRAAADGRVVYQGSGLRGYGQLIIVKHNDEFLSAYAHNDRIHVKEGEAVKRGQRIADMGSTGTDRVKLHFEIRRHGAPVDPLKYLPKR